jgi:hypothetical protein
MKSMYTLVLANLCHWGVSKKSCNAVVRCTSFNRCHIGGMSSSLKCVMKRKYLPRRPSNDLMHTSEMCETSNSSSSPPGIVTGTAGRSGAVEQGRKLFTWNTRCKRSVVGSFNLFFPDLLVHCKRSKMYVYEFPIRLSAQKKVCCDD